MEDNAAELYGSGRDLVALQMSDETTRFAPGLLRPVSETDWH